MSTKRKYDWTPIVADLLDRMKRAGFVIVDSVENLIATQEARFHVLDPEKRRIWVKIETGWMDPRDVLSDYSASTAMDAVASEFRRVWDGKQVPTLPADPEEQPLIALCIATNGRETIAADVTFGAAALAEYEHRVASAGGNVAVEVYEVEAVRKAMRLMRGLEAWFNNVDGNGTQGLPPQQGYLPALEFRMVDGEPETFADGLIDYLNHVRKHPLPPK